MAAAGMDQVGLGKTSSFGWAVLSAMIAGLALGAMTLWNTKVLAWRACAAVPAFISILLISAVVRTLSTGSQALASTAQADNSAAVGT